MHQGSSIIHSPKVSVVVPTYNCAPYLQMALDSAWNQTYQDYKVIVVDDGSTDNTQSMLEPYLNHCLDKVKLIYQVNQDLACALQALSGIYKEEGGYLF